MALGPINSLIWTLFLVAIIAIGLHSIGLVVKLLHESSEEIDEQSVDAVIATGDPSLQIVSPCVVPQILPPLSGISVFRRDTNIRESTILGLTGADGLSLNILSSISVLTWNQISMILVVILFASVASECVSAKVHQSVLLALSSASVISDIIVVAEMPHKMKDNQITRPLTLWIRTEALSREMTQSPAAR